MTDHELDAWLGDTDATDAQRAALQDAAYTITRRYPDPDLADDREQALTAAAQVILGDATLEEHVDAWRAARRIETERHAAMTGALIATGGTEVGLAARAGLTRMTVRKALGKR